MKKTDKTIAQFEKFRISRFDERNLVLEELQEGGIWKATGQKAPDKWVVIGYYGKLEHIISTLINRSIDIPKSPALDEQLKAILAELKRVEKSLLEQMKVIE